MDYKISDKNVIEISHVLLPQIEIKSLANRLSSFKEIVLGKEGKVLVFAENENDIPEILEKFKRVFREIEAKYATTPNFNYEVGLRRSIIKEWFLAIEGSIAVILSRNYPSLFRSINWELIDSGIGGIFMDPYTIIFNQDHPKVIHPITLKNYQDRIKIEQEIAISMRGLLNRLKEAHPGYEGLALASYVEAKTYLDASKIANMINDKTNFLKTPNFSPLIRL